ncbi:MAG: bifunctional adenosylcobinamide kinase/adenosylcobinamide-phosphate guanylyltransferase [Magnetococcales bacterium]|nr:bifunctional adenosylcobinamide kinase/adenosylcobinamide-phosphate guanylyltransferase [Magnetococcales bacterium]NGZ26387.1 bifunctional adenosylcobinamide kinase/adenosylcobinamide-phosphate guanylyltransferase [Magnetococcales bacterium]
MKHLILGGTRSGKSALAERLAQESGLAVVYVATARSLDGEMERRIDAHRQRRPSHWQTVESPLLLAKTLLESAQPDRCLLVDCLSVWMSNLLVETNEERLQQEKRDFLLALSQITGKIILVSNESGLGILPLGELTRRYMDEIGILHQQTATLCQQVTLVVAGLPLTLKGEGLS